jgi:hypothetical protein
MQNVIVNLPEEKCSMALNEKYEGAARPLR